MIPDGVSVVYSRQRLQLVQAMFLAVFNLLVHLVQWLALISWPSNFFESGIFCVLTRDNCPCHKLRKNPKMIFFSINIINRGFSQTWQLVASLKSAQSFSFFSMGTTVFSFSLVLFTSRKICLQKVIQGVLAPIVFHV